MRRVAMAVPLLLVGPFACSGDEGSSALEVVIAGDVFESPLSQDDPSTPLAGVEVCYEQTCDTSDAEGLYSVMVPAQSEVELTYSLTGYGPLLVPITTENQSTTVNADMLAVATLEAFAAFLGTPYPPEGTGFISLAVFSGLPAENVTISGVSFELVDSEGKSFYLNDMGIPSTELTETTQEGVGGFVEVPPGVVSVELSGAVGCLGITTWPEARANTFALPVREGFLTQAVISCE